MVAVVARVQVLVALVVPHLYAGRGRRASGGVVLAPELAEQPGLQLCSMHAIPLHILNGKLYVISQDH